MFRYFIFLLFIFYFNILATNAQDTVRHFNDQEIIIDSNHLNYYESRNPDSLYMDLVYFVNSGYWELTLVYPKTTTVVENMNLEKLYAIQREQQDPSKVRSYIQVGSKVFELNENSILYDKTVTVPHIKHERPPLNFIANVETSMVITLTYKKLPSWLTSLIVNYEQDLVLKRKKKKRKNKTDITVPMEVKKHLVKIINYINK